MNLVAFEFLDYLLEQEVQVLQQIMDPFLLQFVVQVDLIEADQA